MAENTKNTNQNTPQESQGTLGSLDDIAGGKQNENVAETAEAQNASDGLQETSSKLFA